MSEPGPCLLQGCGLLPIVWSLCLPLRYAGHPQGAGLYILGVRVAAPDPHSGLAFPPPHSGTHWGPWYSPAKRQELRLQGRQEAPKVPEEAFLVTCPQIYTVMLAEPLSSLTLVSQVSPLQSVPGAPSQVCCMLC